MKEKFSREVVDEWSGSDDLIMNIIVKKAEEKGIEIESIENYLMPGVIKILEKESRERNLLVVDRNQTQSIF